ncbi:MAG: anthranilate synthase component I [Lentisphaeria bacterium]|nr:anthranilate synthase component I [Lentisphaeria bacterium]
MKSTTREKFYELAAIGEIVPVFQEIPGDMDTPVSLLNRFSEDENVVLLESVEGGEKLGRYSFLGVNPYGLFCVRNRIPHAIINGNDRALPFKGNPLNALRDIIGKEHMAEDSDLPPLPGGAIGYLSYEANGLFEELPPPKKPSTVPECLFMLTDEIIAFDNVHHTIKVIVNVHTKTEDDLDNAFVHARKRIEKLVARIQAPMQTTPRKCLHTAVSLKPEMSKEHFLEMVAKAKHHIVEGDIIQVVPSQAFSTECDIPPLDLYRALRLINPSPYMFFLKLGREILIGSSPETLVRLNHGISQVRPIAGTRPRGKNPDDDLAMEQSLLADEKEKAEHLMLVDLGRNDIGRTAVPGSVNVVDFMHVERYSHVMHLVSDVQGTLRKGLDAFDLLATSFPAGTLSGAPKIRAMEIIHDLETSPRGVYGGAVGYFSYDGNMDLAITIRTMEVRDHHLKVQAGCGIVSDSIPENEYQETINKAKAIFKAVEFAAGGLK